MYTVRGCPFDGGDAKKIDKKYYPLLIGQYDWFVVHI